MIKKQDDLAKQELRALKRDVLKEKLNLLREQSTTSPQPTAPVPAVPLSTAQSPTPRTPTAPGGSLGGGTTGPK